ncbi:leucine rich repeat protein, BspA family [Entamoeba histolytica]
MLPLNNVHCIINQINNLQCLINLCFVSKRFRLNITSRKENVVSISDSNLFSNLNSLRLLSPNDKLINGIDTIIVDYPITYAQFKLMWKNNMSFRHVLLKHHDINSIQTSQPIINFVVPNIIKSIHERCFVGYTQLSSITLSPPIHKLGMYAFDNCSSLQKINLPSSLIEIGSHAFKGIHPNAQFTFNGDVCYANIPLFVSKQLIKQGVQCPNIQFTQEDFMGSDQLNITIPSCCKSIGSDCFCRCFNLTYINLPCSITSLETNCFRECSSISTLSIPSSLISIGNGCFFNCVSLTSLSFPDNLVWLGIDCLRGCSSLVSLHLPSSLSSLGRSCLEKCSSLTTLTLPSSLRFLSRSCFEKCTSLKHLALPTTMTSIGDGCFYNCLSMTSITIPSSVQVFERFCFGNCSQLSGMGNIPKECFKQRPIKC